MLIAVLWMCALLSWVGLMYAAETRFEAERARTLIERERGLYIALSGVHEALARIANRSGVSAFSEGGLKPDGKAWRFDYTGGYAMVRVENELHKVNINLVSRDDLELILAEAGYDEAAPRVAAEIDAYMNEPERMPEDAGAVPRGSLETPEQMVLYPSVDTDMFYGETPYDRGVGREDNERHRIPLFSLFTVVGGNKTLQEPETLEDEQRFEDGGIYRIVSVGRVSEISAASAVWAVVRYNKDAPFGVQILYRKIL